MSRKSLWTMTILTVVTVFVSATGKAAPVPGDINGDGTVNYSDFLILAQNFGKTGDPIESNSMAETDTVIVEPLNQRGFPLAAGNIWKYQATFIENTDTLGSAHFNVEWEVEAQEEVFDVEAFRMRTTQPIDGRFTPKADGYTSRTWLVSTPDTLKGVASQGALPFSEGQLSKPTTLTFSDDLNPWQYNILVFPLVPGNSWSADNSGLGTKTVIEKETISVPAGSFETYKVEYASANLPESTSFNLLIWYGAVGVVKVAYIISSSPPASIGEQIYHSVRIYELVSYRLN